ncbi:hypothetical protein HK101_000762 [Irineochytrium annulatum]|nr:hypothetical protein HK101_000762 [Irineochytrium annulatum]
MTSVVEALILLLQIPFDLDDRLTVRRALRTLLGTKSEDNDSILVGRMTADPTSINVELTSLVSVTSKHLEVMDGNTRRTLHEQPVLLLDLKRKQEEVLARTFRYIYRVLKQFLLGSDAANQVHLAREFDTLLRHVDADVGAADTLMQLISGNTAIVQSVASNQIQHFVDLVVRDRDPSYIKFLIALCYCESNAMPRNQQFIGNSFFKQEDAISKNGHYFKLMINKTARTLDVLPPDAKSSSSWMPLKELFTLEGKRPSLPSTDAHNRKSSLIGAARPNLEFLDKRTVISPIARYFEATLKLYEALSIGQNRAPSLSDYIFTLQDVEERPTLRYVLNDASLDDDTLQKEKLADVAVWIREDVAAHGNQVASQKEQNELVLSVLKLLRFLVGYGLYSVEADIISLFQSLTEILDGRNDVSDEFMLRDLEANQLGKDSQWFQRERFEYSDFNMPIIDAKIEICVIMESLLRLRLEMRVYTYLHYWYRYHW